MYHCLVQLLCFHEKIEVDHFIPWARPIITFFFLAFYEVIQHLKNAATRLILFFFLFFFSLQILIAFQYMLQARVICAGVAVVGCLRRL
jgi:hypothetical protein